MTFGEALAAVKAGKRARRAGWNGKGMHIYLQQQVTILHGQGETDFEPCIVMFTAQGKHQPGWLASQPDMLADDWELVEP